MNNTKLIVVKINKEDFFNGNLTQFLIEDPVIVSVIQGGKTRRFCRNFECKNTISPSARRIYCGMSCQYRMQNIRQKKCRPNSELILEKKKHIERLILMMSRSINIELEIEPKIEEKEKDNPIKLKKYKNDAEIFLPERNERISRTRKRKHFDENILFDDSFSGDDCESDPDYNDQDEDFDFKNVKKKKKNDVNNISPKVSQINDDYDNYDDESFFDDDDKGCTEKKIQEENDGKNILNSDDFNVENLFPNIGLVDFKREDYINEVSQSPKYEVYDDSKDEDDDRDENSGRCCLSDEEMENLLGEDE